MDLDARTRVPLSLSLWPFTAASALSWVAVIVGPSIDWSLYAISATLLLLAGTLAAARSVGDWGARVAGMSASLIFLAAVALLRQSAGGINSGVGVIALIPIFYISLFGDKRYELYVALAGMAAFDLAPIVLVGPPHYPHSQYRAALLMVSISAIIGLVMRHLVADVRHQAGEARGRERVLVQVNQVVRGLFHSTQAREDVCEAARGIGQAHMAMLYEPTSDGLTMRITAMAGMQAEPVEISMDERNAVTETFVSGEPKLVTENVREHVGSVPLWETAGRPESVLCEPLMRGSEPVGVLVVGWPADVRAAGTRAAVVALLAHEAAAVIDRADQLSVLADMASTDPLTGLPNRRAWDARLKQVLARGQHFAIAMLDLDHFKLFNDTYGHPAGDRLLKETAAVWRDQLRTGDLLARLGGEEFGLLMLDCDTAHAVEVINRLRALIYDNRTCSVGFAERRPGESGARVMARADAALYEAKAAGRDRLRLSA